MSLGEELLRKFHVIGDRVLIRPKADRGKTRSGLYLPPGVQEKEEVRSGYIVKTGPGYPVASDHDADEVWRSDRGEPKYIPLQVKEGDEAIYLQKRALEIEFKRKKYAIVPQSAILMVIREEDL